jgi:uncharacterized membrane protein
MPRHDLDVVSLVAGMAFIGVGVLGLLHEATDLAARWALPVLLIAVGVAGLLATRARGHGRGATV